MIVFMTLLTKDYVDRIIGLLVKKAYQVQPGFDDGAMFATKHVAKESEPASELVAISVKKRDGREFDSVKECYEVVIDILNAEKMKFYSIIVFNPNDGASFSLGTNIGFKRIEADAYRSTEKLQVV